MAQGEATSRDLKHLEQRLPSGGSHALGIEGVLSFYSERHSDIGFTHFYFGGSLNTIGIYVYDLWSPFKREDFESLPVFIKSLDRGLWHSGERSALATPEVCEKDVTIKNIYLYP